MDQILFPSTIVTSGMVKKFHELKDEGDYLYEEAYIFMDMITQYTFQIANGFEPFYEREINEPLLKEHLKAYAAFCEFKPVIDKNIGKYIDKVKEYKKVADGKNL